MKSLFHLAYNVTDLDEARSFYGDLRGCFEGQKGEQYTMFFKDPSGNPIEAKGFKNLDTVYDS